MGTESQLVRPRQPAIQAADRPGRVALSHGRLLAAIMVAAVVLRIVAALYQGNTVVDMPGIYDQLSYHGLALRVADGHGFSFAEGHWPATRGGEPTAHWSYLYTLYLAGIYSLFGVQPLLARLVQAIIAGLLHTWLAYRIGRRVFGPTVGLLAAAFSAVYVYFVYYAGGLIYETFYFVTILWTLDVALRLAADAPSRHRRWLWLELGVAAGATVLLRQVFVFFVPFLFACLWLNVPVRNDTETVKPGTQKSTMARLRLGTLPGLVAAGLVVLALMAPFTIRNYRAFGTFVPLNTNAGFALFWGNHPVHGTHFMPLLPGGGDAYIDLIPPDLLTLNEAQLDRALLKEAVGFITADPVRYVLLSFSRVQEYFKFWPTADSGLVSNASRVLSFGVFLPFMLYGLWLGLGLLRRPDHPGQRAQLVLLGLFVVVYTGMHLLTWTLIRYRLPVDAILLLFAALAVARLAARVGVHFDSGAARAV